MSKSKLELEVGEGEFKAQDVLKGTGVTYRMLNNWDAKAFIDPQNRKEGGWRKFSFEEFVCLGIVSKLRKMGVPLDFVARAYRWLLDKKGIVDILEMYDEGTSCFFITNLDDDMNVCGPRRSISSFSVYQYESTPFICVPLNATISELFAKVLDKEPDYSISYDVLDYIGSMVEEVVQARESEKEMEMSREKEMLRRIRKRDFMQVAIRTEEGSLVVDISDEPSDEKLDELKRLIKKGAYTRVSVVLPDGEVLILGNQGEDSQDAFGE